MAQPLAMTSEEAVVLAVVSGLPQGDAMATLVTLIGAEAALDVLLGPLPKLPAQWDPQRVQMQTLAAGVRQYLWPYLDDADRERLVTSARDRIRRALLDPGTWSAARRSWPPRSAFTRRSRRSAPAGRTTGSPPGHRTTPTSPSASARARPSSRLPSARSCRSSPTASSVADGEDGPVPLARIAAASIRRGITYAGAGRGQLVATGAKITPRGRLVLGRRPAALSGQRLDWETTLGALVVESFAEARALAAGGIPAPLAARTPTNGFAVVAVAGADEVGWDPAEHAVTALLRDHAGATATLLHPYTAHGAAGVEALLHGLADATAVRFVAGYVSARERGVRIRPTAVVVEAAGGQRAMLQPWVDVAPGAAPVTLLLGDGDLPLRALVTELREALGDLLTAGVGRPDAGTRGRWEDLEDALEAAGSTLLIRPVRRLNDELRRGLRDRGRGSEAAVAAALELAVMLTIAPDLEAVAG